MDFDFYDCLPPPLIESLARIRQIPFSDFRKANELRIGNAKDSDSSERRSLKEQFLRERKTLTKSLEEWDQRSPEWRKRMTSNSLQSIETNLDLIIFGFVHGFFRLNQDFPQMFQDNRLLREYLTICLEFSGFTPFPPFYENSILDITPKVGKQFLIWSLFPRSEIDLMPDEEVIKILSSRFVPPDLARRVSRNVALNNLQIRFSKEIFFEVGAALMRVYGGIEQFLEADPVSPWEKLIFKIENLSGEEIAKICSIVLPNEMKVENFSTEWTPRIYLLRRIPLKNDPKGERLNFDTSEKLIRR